MAKKKEDITSKALLGVAVIQGIIYGLAWMVHSSQMGVLDRIITFSFAIFVVLAVLAKFLPIVAASIALALYGAFLCLQAIASPALLFKGWLFKGPIVVLLIVAFVVALKRTVEPEVDEADGAADVE